mmetsp:Transcript_17104/g.42446  ORF Transcript_17104/g.42446 Transcript_17104/m.42446 type:complete len:235 (-) Transcript_17104:2456-3160(-)
MEHGDQHVSGTARGREGVELLRQLHGLRALAEGGRRPPATSQPLERPKNRGHDRGPRMAGPRGPRVFPARAVAPFAAGLQCAAVRAARRVSAQRPRLRRDHAEHHSEDSGFLPHQQDRDDRTRLRRRGRLPHVHAGADAVLRADPHLDQPSVPGGRRPSGAVRHRANAKETRLPPEPVLGDPPAEKTGPRRPAHQTGTDHTRQTENERQDSGGQLPAVVAARGGGVEGFEEEVS